LIYKTVNLAKTTLQQHEIEIKCSETTMVRGYINELLHAILNIIFNAKDILIEQNIVNSKIIIELSLEEKFGCVKIKDNANGIPSNIIDDIFNSYFITKEDDKGTGIGLYMSKLIVEEI